MRFALRILRLMFLALQLQQDPNDPSKWVIVDAAIADSSQTAPSDDRKQRQRRHACTCPNCKDGNQDRGL